MCWFYFILLYFIYYYPLEACLFSNGRQKGSRSKWKGNWEGNAKSIEREKHNQNILHEKKICFQYKEKLKGVIVVSWWKYFSYHFIAPNLTINVGHGTRTDSYTLLQSQVCYDLPKNIYLTVFHCNHEDQKEQCNFRCWKERTGKLRY